MEKRCNIALMIANPKEGLWIEGAKNYYHIFVISDDEIREGDYYIHSGITYNEKEVYHTINTCHKPTRNLKDREELFVDGMFAKDCKKIIATTDKSLGLFDENGKYIVYTHLLPQPSPQFIQKYIDEYNKGNVINEVMVEYEEYGEELGCDPAYYGLPEIKLKVNPKDNTITIRKNKDSYTLQEFNDCINFICNQFDYNKRQSIRKLKDKWIEKHV